MKRSIKYIALIACVGLLGACDLKEDRTYDEPTDIRLARALDEYSRALTSAANGWILLVDSNFGVFRHYLSFDENDRVIMLSDLSANYTVKDGTDTTTAPRQSSYQLKALHMPSLIFNTYNYIHMLCDPTYSVMDVPTHYALYSDFEYSILSFDSGVFTLRGTLNKTTAYLRRATKDEADAVFAEHALMNDYARIEGHTGSTLSIGGREVSVSFLEAFHATTTANRNRFVDLTWQDEAGAEQRVQGHMWIELETAASGSGVPTRIGLMAPVSVGDVQIASFRWNADTGAYDAVGQDGTVYTKPAGNIE